jgi:hypothetical protein
MSSVKISELAAITVINANTSNTLLMGVDIPTGITGKFTARTLAQGLYLNEVLNVGNNAVVFPNTIAQFSGNSITYLQMNMQNFNSAGSGDFIVTADTGTNANSFVDLGINNSTFSDAAYSSMKPYDGYLYVHGPSDASASGNLILGTAAANANVSFIIGGTTSGNVIAKLTKTALELQRQITFADGTSQNTSSGSAGTYANAAFLQANTPLAIANSAAIYANGAFVQANAAFLVANTPTHVANSAAAYANAAFLQANTPPAIANSASLYANGAFVQANAAFLVANTPTHVANSAASYANAAFLQANTPSYTANSAAAYANGAFVQANAAFLQANTPSDVANSAATYANGAFIQANAAFLVANTPTHVANSAALYANGAFLQANTPSAIANSAAIYANGAFVQANAAYTKANNALANTSGTFAGDLNITGTLKASGVVTLNNSTFASNTSFLSIVASDDFATVQPSNTNYMIHVTGKANSVTRLVLDSFGQNTYPLVAGRMGRGSATTPTAVANNDIMMRIVGNGYTGTTFPGSSPTKIDFIASENFSDTNRGTRIEFWNTPTGSNTIQQIASFNADTVTFSGTIIPAKGFIFTPRLPAGNQTAITIDYATDSIIKANLTSDLTISHTNFVAGKVVDIWLVNTSGLTRTITHGISSINSTKNATTFTMPSTSAAHLRFFSIDGDLANTFVSITP